MPCPYHRNAAPSPKRSPGGALGLVGALRQQADRISVEGHSDGGETPFAITLIASEPLSPLPAAVEVAVYRIVVEALINVAKHAQARSCLVRLEADESLTVIVEDDGLGCRPNRDSGVGRQSMRERAEELGGSFVISPGANGAGTQIFASLPLSPSSV